jgi:hypothetical protein
MQIYDICAINIPDESEPIHKGETHPVISKMLLKDYDLKGSVSTKKYIWS